MRYLTLLTMIVLMGLACNSASTGESKDTSAKAVAKPTPAVQKTATTNQQTKGAVNWLSIEEAQKMSKKDGKPMLLDVYTYWCGPCKMMDRTTFSNAEVATLINEKFHPVKFNAESPDEVKIAGQTFKNANYRADIPKNRRNSPHDLVRKLGIRGYPTLVVVDDALNIKSSIVGFKQPGQLIPELNKI